jgi:hypothetical protein
MEGNLTSIEGAMTDVHLSQWQEAKEDEMKLKMTNDVWDLEEIEAVGCNGSTR